MKTRILGATVIALVSTLVACGGGGGGGGYTPPTGGATSTPTAVPTTTSATTNASGTLVDDGTGAPLAGARVVLMPWASCAATPAPTSITPESDGCPTPLPSPQVTTAPNGTFALNGVPNGHYVLVIGADAVATVPPGYAPPTPNPNPTPCGAQGQQGCSTPSPFPGAPMQATVHDNVALSGGNQTLQAPTLPTVPLGYTPASWETNGDYRLATMNRTTEMPCLIAWQYERQQNGLAGSSVDEWLLENVRADNAYQQLAAPGSTYHLLATGNASISGGASCASYIDATTFSQSTYATDPRTLWFAGQYVPYSEFGGTNNEDAGLAEFPIDPRSFTDPNHPTWP